MLIDSVYKYKYPQKGEKINFFFEFYRFETAPIFGTLTFFVNVSVGIYGAR